MTEIKSSQLKFKSTGAIVILVAVLSSLSLLTYVYMKRSVAQLSEMIDITVAANKLKVLSGTETEGLPAEIEEYALHPLQEKERKITDTFEQIDSELVKIEEKIRDDDARIQLQLVHNMFTSYHEGFLQIKKFIDENAEFSLSVQEIAQIKENSALINDAIQVLISEELSFQQKEKESLSQTINKTGVLLVAVIILSALVAIGVFYHYIICHSIINPLQNMKETMQRISTNASDIKLRVQAKNNDEIGSLAIFFNQMADTIQKYNEHLEDIVDLRTKQLHEAQAMLVQSSKLSALGEMAGGVAHEINTPLAVISLKIEQLERKVRALAETHGLEKNDLLAYTAVIDKTVERISKIVSGLRAFARDGSKDAMSKVSVNDLIKDSLSLCTEKFANHGIKIEVKADFPSADSAFIQCRETEISQVVINLLNNSFDAIQNLSERWIRIETEDAGDFVRLSIVDSGKGIPKSIQDKMMQPFFTTKEVGKGTGLGLSISKGIIESHSGKLSIDNESPNTKITVLLPKIQSRGPKGTITAA
jgi:C4-dicarboxylate-specific signal transduction histidine kinase